jgi:pimeloyl-ACP methyl ester carboxylesterase
MKVIDRGHGTPLVLVPGIQGRWAYMRPAVDALAERCRVVTFDLCGERGVGRFDPRNGLGDFVAQIETVMDERGLDRAVICGVSFGGLIALQFAASHPERTSALVLASTPGPGFTLRRRHRLYARVPWLFGPLFLAELPRRVRRELRMAIPDPRARLRFSWRQAATLLRAPVSMSRLATRARLIGATDLPAACRAITAPTLVVCGEPSLDHVVPADGASAYADLIPGARTVRLDRTGHLGSITRPGLFASVVGDFVDGQRHAAA